MCDFIEVTDQYDERFFINREYVQYLIDGGSITKLIFFDGRILTVATPYEQMKTEFL